MMSAEPYVPHSRILTTLKRASRACRGCDLYREATQTVFGEGPARARVVMIGEQPGNREDQEGRPFVGPSGALLDKALAEIKMERREIYVTNIVKHFRFIQKGKIRFHRKPSGEHKRACRPWLDAEMAALRPSVTVCLGVTAAESLLGRKVTIRDERGHLLNSPLGGRLIVTVHPSSILRMPDEASRHAEYRHFGNDLRALEHISE